MTVLERDANAISNYFDRLTDGIGHRGSSFADIDAVTHDGRTARFLFQEFKRDGEACKPGQRILLHALSKLPGVSVWYVMVKRDKTLTFANMADEEPLIITPDEYRQRFADWWTRR